MLCRQSISFIRTDVRAPPNTVQGILRFWKTFSFGWYEAFQKHSNLWLGRAPPNTAQKSFTVLKNHFLWMLCSNLNTFKFMAGPRSPTSLVTAQLILRRWRNISLGCCADFQQRSNERMVVFPQTLSRSFHGVEDFSHLDGMKLFKNIRTHGWAVFSQNTAQFLSQCWKTFSSDVMQPCKHIQVDGWAPLPNIPCHGPAHFAALRNLFVLMLCRLSTTFKWTDGCAPPNTAQLFSRCWKHFFLDGIKRFKNIRAYGWAVLPHTRPSSFHGVEEPFRRDVLQPFKNTQEHGWAALPNIPCNGPAHFAALKNHFVLMFCRHSITFK